MLVCDENSDEGSTIDKGAGLDGTKTNRKKRASDGIDALRATASVLVALHAEDEGSDDTEEFA